MDASKTDRLLQLFLLLGTFTSLLSLAHYGRKWRPPNRAEMNKKVTHFNIIPDVIDKKQNLTFIHVKYRQTVTVQLGNKVPNKAISDPPANITWEANNNTFHTLLLVDPDWPIKKPRSLNEFPHWFVGNIPGNQVEQGETIFEYVGYRATVIDENPHRYTFLVYSQPSSKPIEFDEPRLNKSQDYDREKFPNFSARHIASKYNLTNIGVNFFLVSHEKPYENDDHLIDIEYWDD